MPIVELHLLEGYDSTEKTRLGRALTDAVRFVVPAPLDAVTVMIHEMPADRYYRGGTRRSPAPALPEPEGIVRTYLAAMEARDLPRAEAMLAPDFVMQFPGTTEMTELAELIAWSRPRYDHVRKTYTRFDALQGAGDEAVVYCYGTLSGAWTDGTPFEGIRFIDRFEIEGGRIRRQDVWNDMAEAKAHV